MKRRGLLIFLTIFFLTSFILGTIVCYFVLTEEGSRIIAELVISRFVETQDKTIGKIDGTLKKGISFKNLEFQGLKGLPSGNILRIQRLDIIMHSFDFKDATLEVENARLTLPASEPIVFYGSYKKENLNFTVYSKSIDIREIFSILPRDETMSSARGTIADLDINIKGSLFEPILKGKFLIEQFYNKDIMLLDSAGTLSLSTKDIRNNDMLYGDIILKEGFLIAKDTNVKIQESKISFAGDRKNSALFFDGVSDIDSIKIKINLRGTMNKPELRLASDSGKSQEMLMIMLATGKRWESFETSMGQGKLSPDLSRDLLDYLFFSGSGEKIARKFGIKDFRLTIEKDKKGVGVKKEILQGLDVNYEIQEIGQQNQPTQTNHKVGGDLKVTEAISLSAEKEIKAGDQLKQGKESPANDKVLLKYKKDF